MTFKDVIMKNFYGDMKKYVSYFLSGVFCVAMFFIYSTLLLLDEISENVETYPMDVLMVVTCLMISLFSIFFINYSHNNFVMNKKKELGTYMILGMNAKDGNKLLAAETGIIAFASIITGMVTGAVFSRLFQLIALKLIGIHNIETRLSVINFVITAIVFIVIYFICFVISVRKINKEDLTFIIKEKRMKEGKKFKTANVLLLILGLLLMTFSILFLLAVAGNNSINYKITTAITFVGSGYIGLFLVISNGISCIIALKKEKRNYYENMLAVSGMDYKFKQNAKIIIILAMLASMIVLLVGSPISLLTISEDIAEDGSSDFEYMLTSDIDENRISEILSDCQVASDEVTEVSYVYNPDGKIVPVINKTDYNEKYDASINVENGEIVVVNVTWVPGSNGYEVGKKLVIQTSEGEKKYTISGFEKETFTCVNLFSGGAVYVVSDEDYKLLESVISHSEIHKIDCLSSWKNSKNKANELAEYIGDNGLVNSRYAQYLILKHGYSIFLFVSCSMCFMFFISTGFVLYFKQYNDIEDDRNQYMQLYRMGISDKVVKKSIRKKMSVVYFTPILGSIMGIAIMYYLSNLFGGTSIVKVFMSKSFVGFGLYLFSQIMFYIFLYIEYSKDVTTVEEI